MIESAIRLPGELTGERVLLRRWTADDVSALAALVTRNLEHLRPWMPWINHEPLADADRAALLATWERAWLDGGDATFGVFLDGQPIGGTGLHRRRGPHGLEIGYWIDKDHVGRGLATEVARVLTSAALATPGITFVEIHHDKANIASSRVPQHLGYTFVGETPDQVTSPAEIGIDCAWRMQGRDWHG